MALVMSSGTERAFLRAEELLRTESALTSPQLEELEELFHELSGTQFMALISNSQHDRVLRQYDRYIHKRVRPIIAGMTVLFVISVIIGGILVLSH